MLDVPMPPAGLRFMGASDEEFVRVGDRVVRSLRELAGLEPAESVLEIGCGYGRVAHALLRSGHAGPYTGMDILPRHVEWCASNITPATDGRFRFVHMDIQNDRYNKGGRLQPTQVDLRLGALADVVLLASVFTHMLPEAVAHYVGQLPALLRSGGRVLATFFLMNESQSSSEAAGGSAYPLHHELTPFCRYWNADDPLHVIAYDEAWVRALVQEAGLSIRSVHLGSWCGRAGVDRRQDTLVLEKA